MTSITSGPWLYEVALAAQRIRFSDSFENLICLPNLQNVQSLWYQEETARKVLKSFRGRALLSDEVGLGKTIEAGIILKEYIQRGMVKSALILTPTPLVSQWKEELKPSSTSIFHPPTILFSQKRPSILGTALYSGIHQSGQIQAQF
jgi:SNF2 family DNA or RNA helicase